MDSMSVLVKCDASIGGLRAIEAPGIGHRAALG
jgi:hypothetical protein